MGGKVGLTCDDCQSKISKMLSCEVKLTPENVTWIPIISTSVWKRYLLSNAHSYLGVLYIEFYRGVQHSIRGCQKMWPANPGSQGHPARDIPVFHNYAHQLGNCPNIISIYILYIYIFNITIDTEKTEAFLNKRGFASIFFWPLMNSLKLRSCSDLTNKRSFQNYQTFHTLGMLTVTNQ